MPCYYLWLVNQRSSAASFQLVNLSLIGHGFNQVVSAQITSFYLHLITIYLAGNFNAFQARYLLLIDLFESNKWLKIWGISKKLNDVKELPRIISIATEIPKEIGKKSDLEMNLIRSNL